MLDVNVDPLGMTELCRSFVRVLCVKVPILSVLIRDPNPPTLAAVATAEYDFEARSWRIPIRVDKMRVPAI